MAWYFIHEYDDGKIHAVRTSVKSTVKNNARRRLVWSDPLPVRQHQRYFIKNYNHDKNTAQYTHTQQCYRRSLRNKKSRHLEDWTDESYRWDKSIKLECHKTRLRCINCAVGRFCELFPRRDQPGDTFPESSYPRTNLRASWFIPALPTELEEVGK